jgi:hypothetical protein
LAEAVSAAAERLAQNAMVKAQKEMRRTHEPILISSVLFFLLAE